MSIASEPSTLRACCVPLAIVDEVVLAAVGFVDHDALSPEHR
jgi:hypothetical protein